MTKSALLFCDLLIAALCFAALGCQQQPDDVQPTDTALLGRWDVVVPKHQQHYPVRLLPKRSMEFLADGRLRLYRNDTLTLEGTYQHRGFPKNVQAPDGLRYLSLSNGQGNSGMTYELQQDTLRWSTPMYKDVMNCWPMRETYARATATAPPGK
ncbi:hypothetical protein D3Y59_08755 [Hymenobacter oligotrophus]|uniref:Lipocalin-like domain-containing protein n=1 Tax=Hymenobacter oligotrophus TaxID=2319843 RepID=A0A3B7R141_9BACT|nr:hypothetical protein [Hymenobacter oligotrophus]AYA37133.1 hypothetical protein D3Y59_08755 [Hymenobacter oligotrophus]